MAFENYSLRSFFLGGFECSAHRRPDGTRLDLLATSGHDRWAREDYQSLTQYGMHAARDGLRWHIIETSPGHYDWSSFVSMLHAASDSHTQVIWDLCHYGWPDHLDIWSARFVEAFGRFAGAAARIVRDEMDEVPFYCPVNEISYWAWAGGQVGRMNPSTHARGNELKRQLVRASLAAMDAVRCIDPRARFITAEPLIHVTSGSSDAMHRDAAVRYHGSQFEVHDMLCGMRDPELGGRPEYLDFIGANFYPDCQWYLDGSTIPLGHHAYQPLEHLLWEVHERYHRPIVIAETGAEGRAKAYWLHHVCAEVSAAMERGAQIAGICLYPIVDYHGWDNDRLCDVGLFGLPNATGRRDACPYLSAELQRQQLMHELRRLAPSYRMGGISGEVQRLSS